MKVKVRPEDFLVREESRFPIASSPGRFQVFRLTKSQWDTFDLVDLLARRLGVPRRDISYGGIKDRFGRTEQLVSIRVGPRAEDPARRGRGGGGPRRGLAGAPRGLPGLAEKNFELVPLGYAGEPVTAKSILGNRFTITLRDIEERRLEPYLAACESVRRWGVPNYYDEQRFGSARHGKGFMGKEIFLARREKALRLYFQPSKYDDRKTRRLKKCVIERWDRWAECLPLAFGEYRRVLEYLAGHRSAFTQALARIDRRFLIFVLNAYQSFLFNEILAGYLQRLEREARFPLVEAPYRWGVFRFYRHLPEELFRRLRERELPVPGHDSVFADPRVAETAAEVLAREGLALADLRARQLSGVRVGGAERRMIVLPEGLRCGDIRADELYPEKRRLTLEFFLPRGSYATLILKRIEAEESFPNA